MNAVELDEALARATPEDCAAAWADAPAGFADQLATAAVETVALAEAAHGAGHARCVPARRIADWVRLGVLDTFCQWTAGRAKTCIHSPRWDRPAPAWACAWKPGLVVCTPCLDLFKVTGEAAFTCDGCGRVCAGPDADDDIRRVTVFFGALAFEAGACADCAPDWGPE